MLAAGSGRLPERVSTALALLARKTNLPMRNLRSEETDAAVIVSSGAGRRTGAPSMAVIGRAKVEVHPDIIVGAGVA